MNLKSILLHSFVTIIAVFLGLSLFYFRDIDECKSFQETLSFQIIALENHLSSIESILGGHPISASPNPNQPSNSVRSQEDIERSLRSIIQRLSLLETRVERYASSKIPANPAASAGNLLPRRTPGKDPMSWVRNLPETKQQEVENIFREHQEFIRKNLPGGLSPDREKNKEVLEKSQQILKDKLKAVLDEKEYQAFLDSLPKSRNPVLDPIPSPEG